MSDQSMGQVTEPTQLIGDTTARQMRAATPSLSVWVSANAGSGKTHVLSQRVVRLLLNGTPPSAILCLTYTKAAAAEMSLRIFDILANWSQMNDEALSKTLGNLEDRKPSREHLSFARKLFAAALETPGGLKIQTIHAFCEALLHRFPLEANVAGHFQVLDDEAALSLLTDARRIVLNQSANADDENLSHALNMILDHSGESGLNDLLDQIIRMRHPLIDFIQISDAGGGIRQSLAENLEIEPELGEEDYMAQAWPLPSCPPENIDLFYDLAFSGKQATPKKLAQSLMDAKNATDNLVRFNILRDGFLTKVGQPRKLDKAVTKDILEVVPEISENLEHAQNHILEIEDRIKRKACLDATEHALVLAKFFIETFEGLKRQKAVLDYDDLIIQTANLFQKSGAGPWVHYKLDQGIDHILIDEAQDTSPNQWNVVQSLASEFFSGQSSRELARTMFAVGDEKQSIYSFQGARPERFDQERRRTSKQAHDAQKDFDSIPLRVSFRSSQEVLSIVDLVFENDEAKRGLSFSGEDIAHETVRQNAPGEVQLWDMLVKPKKADQEDWLAPFDAVSDLDPIAKLSRRIAGTLEDWIGREKILDQKTGKLRVIKAGDIMILVRKRDAFVPTLMRTLKTTTDIPVAGADRLRLTDHIAVQDLIALGRTILLKEDDLSLAALLKSILFNLDEDQIFELCAKRQDGQSVWAEILVRSETSEFWQNIKQRISRYQARAKNLSVHDFYSHVLGPEGVRQKFLDRLGDEVTDVLDEFLSAALDHDQNGIPGMQNFLQKLEQTKPDIKRELDHDIDAVRIMTVHASKGLEAPIVFLVDPGSAAFHSSHIKSLRLKKRPEHQAHLPSCPLWIPGSQIENDKTTDLKANAEQLAEEEYRRLLYVGLTRAADRLIVCGYRGSREPKNPTWHGLVSRGFDHAAPEMINEINRNDDGDDWRSIIYARPDISQRLEDETADARMEGDYSKPDALNEQAEKPETLPRPLVPSGASAIIEAEDTVLKTKSPFAASDMQGLNGLEYGKAIHRLLQVLPEIPVEEWQERSCQYLARALPALDEDARMQTAKKIIQLLTTSSFAPIFSKEGASEISIMGSLDINGEERIVSGRIDRLVVLEDKVIIVDYKTNLHAPESVENVSPNYISQLAIYRAVLQPLYPCKVIEAALLYTRLPSLIIIPEAKMDAAITQLSSK